MAEDTHHPHDSMVVAVLKDPSEAASLLRRYLPEEVQHGLNWSTLRIAEGSFVDEDMSRSHSDILYEVERASGEDRVWVYTLIEHQSTPDRWMRFRLLKYCCRIWDLNLTHRPTPRELRPIVPLVYYQGERRWSYPTEFAELFAESVREWPGTPRFSHGLIDQSGMQPDEVQGELKVQLMQLLLMAAYHPTRAWMDQVAGLLNTLLSLPPSGGVNYVRIFVRYLLTTQEPEAAQAFREVLRRHDSEVGEDVMGTYAQELLAEGEEKGRAEGREEGKIRNQVQVIENLLRLGEEWSRIEEITGVGEAQFQALKQQVADMNESG